MKRISTRVALSAAALVVVVAVALGMRHVGSFSTSTCSPPVTLMPTESQASIEVLERYIAINIAPHFKHPDQIAWYSDDYSPTLKPGKIAASIGVAEGSQGFFGFDITGDVRIYDVVLRRECAGGEWEVVKFSLAKGQPLEPKKMSSAKPVQTS